MKKNLIFALVVAGVGAFLYITFMSPASPLQEDITAEPPTNFNSEILVKERFTLMGAETMYTVYKDGTVEFTSDLDEDVTYQLSNEELVELQSRLDAAGTKRRVFTPDPNIVYDGTYSLEVNYNGYVQHSDSDELLNSAMEIVHEAHQTE